jgi:tetratricopeptide (TPR) repeat protein
MTLNNLGNLYSNTGRLEKTEQAYSEALDIRRRLATANPGFLPDLGMTLNNLGVLYSETGRMDQAEQAYSEALDIYKKERDYSSQFEIYPSLVNAMAQQGVLEYSGLAGHVCDFLELFSIFKSEEEAFAGLMMSFISEKTFEKIDAEKIKENIKDPVCGERFKEFLEMLKTFEADDKAVDKDSI